MLELKTYSYSELSQLFGTRDRQGIQRRLDRYDVEYTVRGRAATAEFTITAIRNPFKLFCIMDLGFAAQTDFYKLKYFIYYLLNDDEFVGLPCEAMQNRLDEDNHLTTRQTIRTYLRKLSDADLINLRSYEYRYYFAICRTQINTTRETYSAAWQEYWQLRDEGLLSIDAMQHVIRIYGGVPRKQEIIEFNGIYNDIREYLNDLACKSIEADLGNIK